MLGISLVVGFVVFGVDFIGILVVIFCGCGGVCIFWLFMD